MCHDLVIYDDDGDDERVPIGKCNGNTIATGPMCFVHSHQNWVCLLALDRQYGLAISRVLAQ